MKLKSNLDLDGIVPPEYAYVWGAKNPTNPASVWALKAEGFEVPDKKMAKEWGISEDLIDSTNNCVSMGDLVLLVMGREAYARRNAEKDGFAERLRSAKKDEFEQTKEQLVAAAS